jgi:hypothetical protein
MKGKRQKQRERAASGVGFDPAVSISSAFSSWCSEHGV